MFSGIIEEKGAVQSISVSSSGMELSIACSKILEDAEIGASIAVNGACQTICSFSKESFLVQASNETLNVSNFRHLKKGCTVNLERALTLGSRINGHIVSGHIDCTAEFEAAVSDGFSKRLFFKLPENFLKYIIYKGSIAVNGVSLTIASIENNIFSCAVIPSTLKETNLSELETGSLVNIETDLFSKYIENIIKYGSGKKFNLDFLAENGFV